MGRGGGASFWRAGLAGGVAVVEDVFVLGDFLVTGGAGASSMSISVLAEWVGVGRCAPLPDTVAEAFIGTTAGEAGADVTDIGACNIALRVFSDVDDKVLAGGGSIRLAMDGDALARFANLLGEDCCDTLVELCFAPDSIVAERIGSYTCPLEDGRGVVAGAVTRCARDGLCVSSGLLGRGIDGEVCAGA